MASPFAAGRERISHVYPDPTAHTHPILRERLTHAVCADEAMKEPHLLLGALAGDVPRLPADVAHVAAVDVGLRRRGP